jgi:hypothetical protein
MVGPTMARKDDFEQTARYADMLAAMGTEPRLRILRRLPGFPYADCCTRNRVIEPGRIDCGK